MPSARSQRQSFLGPRSDEILQSACVAIIGVSGGGSPIAQQLAHVGYGTVHLIDPDFVEEHHAHRLVGISKAAIRNKWNKVDVARRLMNKINPSCRAVAHPGRWQNVLATLLECDLVFSCVDGYLERDELERFLRRYEMPLIDVGMDVYEAATGHHICGQVITSIPGQHCMRCFGLIRDDLLEQEAARYGAAGGAPQVVWPNGVLASTAVGIATAMFLPWNTAARPAPYLVYDGDRSELAPSPRLRHLAPTCPHYPIDQVPGDFRLPLAAECGSPIKSRL